MNNELILIASIIILYGAVLVWFKFFGTQGLFCFTVFATITANIEVLILVDAYGMEMTLGNILFATTFLVTDIISEIDGKKAASKAVKIGIATSVLFLIVSQSWLLYTPNGNDFAFPSIQTIFSNTPRLIFASVFVYAVVQVLDVWLYHKWWAFTSKTFGNSRKYLWLRNNGSTLISQLLNAFMFTYIAFAGVYDSSTIVSITFSSYVVFLVLSLADTPIIYLARHIHENRK